jgi:UDPglucose--hexose-1-phosphate uridylyltransferase
MRPLNFEKETRGAELCDPLSEFAPEVQWIEYRRDPLTGMSCRINTKRTGRAKQAALNNGRVTRIIGMSRKNCVFCPENLESMTPCFPDYLAREKRIRVGSAVLFPNLYPFGEYHAIAVFSDEHDLPLERFSPETINDCICACIEYLTRVRRINQDVKYGSINWNYLPPAGASIVHPHLQVLADRRPTYLLEKLMQCGQTYRNRYGSNYWDDLVETERKLGERFIAGGSPTWLAAYAPQSNNEILGVFHGLSSITEMGKGAVGALSDGLSKVLKGYSAMGVESLNMSLLSGPLDSTLEYYTLHLKIDSRPGLEQYYTSDCGFMEKIQLESVIESTPEDVAEKIRRNFVVDD